MFSYEEFTSRNLGFLSESQQKILKKSHVFIPGVGGMGGVVLNCLARMGVENFTISDPDTFEVSNLNRQVFSAISQINKSKAEVAKNALQDINPHIRINIVKSNWPEELDSILPHVNLIVNGCDDIRASITLHRKAKSHNLFVVDAFASLFPNVFVVKPKDPRPEDFLNFQTKAQPPDTLSDEQVRACLLNEITYTLTQTSSFDYIVHQFAQEMLRGVRKRFSLAPMVWTTGTLMTYEALKILLHNANDSINNTDINTFAPYKGLFLNPYQGTFERPLPWLIFKIKYSVVKKKLASF